MSRRLGSGEFGGPDWIILGVPSFEGVMVIASRDLTHAALEAYRDECNTWLLGTLDRAEVPVRYVLVAETRTVVIAQGDTYADAVAALFRFWQPDAPAEQLLSAPQPALPEASA